MDFLNIMDQLQEMYHRRFRQEEVFRKRMWEILCRDFFQRYVPKQAAVLDIAAGHCYFINAVRAQRKYAVDLNPDVRSYAAPDVTAIVGTALDLKVIEDSTINLAFTSNFFEHISREEIIRIIREVRRVLVVGGRFLLVQPNFRFCYRDYWSFFDHITPLDDRSLREVLELNNFVVKEVRAKFLPYSFYNRLPRSLLLLRIYLRLPMLQNIFGKQTLILAEKQKTQTNHPEPNCSR